MKSDFKNDSDCDMEKDKWTYNSKKDKWEVSMERLKLYFEIKDIEGDKKKKLLRIS